MKTAKFDELKSSYNAGDVIFRSKPYAWCLANKFFNKYCHYCCAPLPYANDKNLSIEPASGQSTTIVVDALKCLRCELAVYCSAECKKRAWCLGGHRKECVLFQSWTKAYRPTDDRRSISIEQHESDKRPSTASSDQENKPPTSLSPPNDGKTKKLTALHWLPHELTRIMSRIIIKLAHGVERNTDDAIGECDCTPETGVAFKDLMPHWQDERENDPESNTALLKVFQQLDDAFPADWDEEREFLKWNRLGEVFGRIMTNAFCIEEYVNLKLIGLSVYLCPAKVDHSCRPNVSYAMRNGIELEMVAIESISSSELARTSYLVDLSDPRDLRRYDLGRQWYFQCGCDGCEDDTRERRIAAIQCPHYECGAAMYVEEALIRSAVRMQQPLKKPDAGENVTCRACGRCDISAYHIREAASCMDEMVAFMKSPKEMLFVGDRLLRRKTDRTEVSAHTHRITSFVHISNGLMPTYLLTYLDTLHQIEQDEQTVSCIINKRMLRATLLLLTVESLSQTLDLWPKNYFCHGNTILRAFRHLHRFVSAEVENAEDKDKTEHAVKSVFSTIADQNNRLLIHAGGIPRREPGRQLAQNAVQLLNVMQECFQLHFGERRKIADELKVDKADRDENTSHPILNELSKKHAPLVEHLRNIFLSLNSKDCNR